MARLAGNVHLQSPETGRGVVFGPDDDLPDWVYEQVTNPRAWEGGELPESPDDEGEDGARERQLTAMRRPEVDAVASELGLTPDHYPNKPALVAAVLERESETPEQRQEREEAERQAQLPPAVPPDGQPRPQ